MVNTEIIYTIMEDYSRIYEYTNTCVCMKSKKLNSIYPHMVLIKVSTVIKIKIQHRTTKLKTRFQK